MYRGRRSPTFRRKLLDPISESKSKSSNLQEKVSFSISCWLIAWFKLRTLKTASDDANSGKMEKIWKGSGRGLLSFDFKDSVGRCEFWWSGKDLEWKWSWPIELQPWRQRGTVEILVKWKGFGRELVVAYWASTLKTASDHGLFWWSRKDLDGKWSWPNWGTISGGSADITRYFSKDSRCLDRDTNRRSPELKSAELPSCSWHGNETWDP